MLERLLPLIPPSKIQHGKSSSFENEQEGKRKKKKKKKPAGHRDTCLAAAVGGASHLQRASERQMCRSSRQLGLCLSWWEQEGTMVRRRRSAHAWSGHEQNSSG